MKPVQVAYMAGLMDGEGCFTIIKSKANNTPIGTQYGIRVEFCMCDRGPIEMIAELFDRPISERKLPSGRTGYCVNLHAAKAAAFTKLVLKHLRGKQDQAKLILAVAANLPGRGKSHNEVSVAAIETMRAELYHLKRSHLLRC